MELSLNALVERLDDHLFEQSSRAWRVYAASALPGPAVDELPELTRPDAVRHVQELVAGPRTDEGKRARLLLLLRELTRRFARHRAADVDAGVRHLDFPALGRQWTLEAAFAELPRRQGRDTRTLFEGALTNALADAAPRLRQRLELEEEALAELWPSPLEAVEAMHGRPLAQRCDDARTFLRETRDAFIDLTGYALKRLDARLTPKQARLHDVRCAARAPWLLELFPRESLSSAVTRCLQDLGFDPSAGGRITVDQEPRADRPPGARLFELRVPDALRLALAADAGHDVWASWLDGWGLALARASTGAALPFVERRLGDAALRRAPGLLFSAFLMQEGWLRRYPRLSGPQAREAARMVAFSRLVELRTLAAVTLAHHDALSRRSGTGGAAWDALLAETLGAPGTPGELQWRVAGLGDAALELDAWALERRLTQTLTERYNEDFYRNPAAGRWLQDLWSHGQGDDAAQVAQRLGDERLDLSLAGRRLVQVLGA